MSAESCGSYFTVAENGLRPELSKARDVSSTLSGNLVAVVVVHRIFFWPVGRAIEIAPGGPEKCVAQTNRACLSGDGSGKEIVADAEAVRAGRKHANRCVISHYALAADGSTSMMTPRPSPRPTDDRGYAAHADDTGRRPS
jgi:hypothetical protein